MNWPPVRFLVENPEAFGLLCVAVGVIACIAICFWDSGEGSP